MSATLQHPLLVFLVHMTGVLGPAVGGAMIAAFGAAMALWVSAFWFLISFLTLWPLRKVQTHQDAHPAPRKFTRFMQGQTMPPECNRQRK